MSLRRLEWTLGRSREDLRRIAQQVGRYYHPFDIQFHGDHKWRHIDDPGDALKRVQGRINTRILSTVTLPPTMLGGVRGCSVQQNMALHVARPCLARVDLRDFFPRTGPRRVFRMLREVFGSSHEIASLLTRLTTFQHRLPQGSPSSPALANLSVLDLHDEIRALAEDRGLWFSMWVDDIALSGDADDVRQAIGPVLSAIHRHGHAVRCRKVDLMPSHRSQRLTGGTLNRKVSAGRKRIQAVREKILALAEREEVCDRDLQSVRGSVQFVSHCCASQGQALRKFAEERLPAVGLPGKKKRRFKVRRCRRARRHRRAA